MLNVTVLTVFPELFPGFLGYSLTGKALEEQKWQLQAVNIRDYAFDRHKSVDDTPCGGGAGMIMRPDVLGRAIEANHTRGRIIYMSPKGRPLTQKLVHELSREEELTIVCGRFEGIDERVIEAYNVEEISIGDYILTGGEQAAQIMLDAVVRLLPGVLGNEASLEDESFENFLLEYPQYTRPTEWEGRSVPEVLLSGHHRKIADWRREQAEIATKAKRPDLFKKYLDSKNS
ncbi:MAG: tRNA (guanosine(37)-N1)-methyltransferase TrmD [Alphaproteobacteria bacterium]|jgi:tRNA (guanine37-N1)-methyltransferase|nr:tRNA (guanosine(37)-N1)-methyltransferase TrmD [Acetobacter sp.]OLA64894.1 MAG: tRNA (guanosine(37)-N1)-methyltransferase TrmD [Acetobacter sp. 46_36]CDA17972.1 tRNA (guanine-N(1)-)-methyltransferase [Acetobacter sp. CAG:267]